MSAWKNSLLSSEEQRSSFRAEKAPVIHEAEYKSPPSLRASKKEGFVKKTTISQSVDDTKLPQREPDLSKMSPKELGANHITVVMARILIFRFLINCSGPPGGAEEHGEAAAGERVQFHRGGGGGGGTLNSYITILRLS